MSSTENSRKTKEPLAQGSGSDLFSLKVMRFPHPFQKACTSLVSRGVSGEPAVARRGMSQGYTYVEPTGITNELSLSAGSSRLFRGESSRMSVVISHRSQYTVSSVGVRIEVQTQRSRKILVDTMKTPRDLKRGQTLDYFLDFKLSEPGENALVCCVFHRDEDRQIQNFQKFFKFQADEPFDFATRVLSAGSGLSSALVQASVKNKTDDPCYIQSLSLIPGDGKAVCTDISTRSDPAERTQLMYIRPGETHTFAFRVDMSERQRQAVLGENGVVLGQLALRWRRMGNVCELFGPEVRLPGATGNTKDVTLRVVECPAEVHLERAFRVTVEVECLAITSLIVNLVLLSHRNVAVVPTGKADFSLGSLKPKECRRVTISLLPLALGVQRLSGFCLQCPEVQSKVQFDDFHRVLVLKQPPRVDVSLDTTLRTLKPPSVTETPEAKSRAAAPRAPVPIADKETENEPESKGDEKSGGVDSGSSKEDSETLAQGQSGGSGEAGETVKMDETVKTEETDGEGAHLSEAKESSEPALQQDAGASEQPVEDGEAAGDAP